MTPKNGFARASILAGLLVCMTLPAQAGLFDDDEARLRIEGLRTDLNEQVKRLDAATGTASRNQIELNNQIEQIKADVARLRGQLEVLTYDLEAAQKRQKDFYVDLDNRLRKIEAEATEDNADAVGSNAPAGNKAAVDPAAELRDYETALTQFKGAHYKEALAAFQNFIRNYGQSAQLPSAHYWAASAYYQLREYLKAADLFGKIPVNWPNDAKAPDALLNQANSLREAGDIKGAKKALEQLVEKYPASNAAQAAKPRLGRK